MKNNREIEGPKNKKKKEIKKKKKKIKERACGM